MQVALATQESMGPLLHAVLSDSEVDGLSKHTSGDIGGLVFPHGKRCSMLQSRLKNHCIQVVR